MEHIRKCLSNDLAVRKAQIDAEFIRYARTKFTDISDALIERNLCEIIAAYDAEFKCKSCCRGLEMCHELLNSAGYTYKMNLQSSGWIKIEYVPCMFNSGKKTTMDSKKSKIIKNKVMIKNR